MGGWPIAPGATGPTGPAGPPGEDGADGDDGAPGPAGSANISGTANKVIKFTDTDVGGDSAITEDDTTCTVVLPLVAQVDAVGTATTAAATALKAVNATTTSGGNTVQNSPRLEVGGRAFVSSVDTRFAFFGQMRPATSGTYRFVFSRIIDASESEVGQFTNSSPSQFVGGFIATSGFGSQNNNGFWFESDNAGMSRSGSGGLQLFNRATGDYFHLRSPVTPGGTEAFRFYANGGNWSATQKPFRFGDDSGGSFVEILAILGDGMPAIGDVRISGWNVRELDDVGPTPAAIGDRINANTNSAAVGVELPAVPSTPSVRAVDIIVTDISGNALVNNITITAAAGDNINGSANFLIDVDFASIELCHDGDGATWRVVGGRLI